MSAMISTLIMVWVLHIAALVTPGANVLLVTHLAANGDRRAAMWAAAGITLGAVIWSTAAVLGALRSNALYLTTRGSTFVTEIRKAEAAFEDECMEQLGGARARDQLLTLLAKLSG